MNERKILLCLVGLMSLALLINKEINNIKQILVKIKSIKPNFKEAVKYALLKLPIDVVLSMNNITVFQVEVLMVNLKISINNIYLGDVIRTSPFTIMAKKEQLLGLTILLNLKEIGFGYSQLIDLFKTKNINIKIEGEIKTSSGVVLILQEFNAFTQ